MLYFRWIEGLRGIRHTNGTQSRLTRTGRQLRARRTPKRTTRRARAATSAGVSARLPASPDLAARLRLCQTPLRRQLARADVLAEMIRAVNASLDPVRVADAMLSRLSTWVPAGAWLMVAAEEGSSLRQVAARGLTAKLEPVAHAVARLVVRSGSRFASADLSQDRSIAGRHGCGGDGLSARVSRPDGRRGRRARSPRSRAGNRSCPAPPWRHWSRRSSRARSHSTTRCACSAPKRCRSPTI